MYDDEPFGEWSLTYYSDQDWLERRDQKVVRYLRRFDRKDRARVKNLIKNVYPVEGRKLIENYKHYLYYKDLYFEPKNYKLLVAMI